MTNMTTQRELVVKFKKESLLNLKVLSKIKSMPTDLSRQVFNENALEKLTQPVFNHLAYYLVSIIDHMACASLSWPLYDSKSERTYRNDLAVFISAYSNKGLISPVMSSYLVNPGCYKVTYLIFQLTQLAVHRILQTKMDKEKQKTYNDMTEKYKSQKTSEFINSVDKTSEVISYKVSVYLRKREFMEKNSEVLRKRILSMEEKLRTVNAQEYLNKLVDGFVKNKSKNLDEKTKNDLLKIKNINEKPLFFDRWLRYVDEKLDSLETEWSEKMTPLLNLSKEVLENSETLIARRTGEVDRSSYTVEFNPKTDTICTKDLEDQVNSEQKYVLKNIVKDNRQSFPNLIRGFLVSISFIFNDTEIGEEIMAFNECLDGGIRSYKELVSALRVLVERVINAEGRLQITSIPYNKSISMKEFSEIPPLPDLSDLRMTKIQNVPSMYDTFTPWNMRRHQFNLRSKIQTSFSKSSSKMLVTPFYHTLKHDILSSRVSVYDQMNSTINLLNSTIMSAGSSRANETIAECKRAPTSGFTKEQIQRLLSTKKSTVKKPKFKLDKVKMNIKRGGLFNESVSSSESTILLRSQSSPNLFDNKEKISKIPRPRMRTLSIMKEGTPALLEVSGIAALEKDSGHSTPQDLSLGSCRKLIDSSSMPVITITPTSEKISKILSETEVDFNKENVDKNSPSSFKINQSKINTPSFEIGEKTMSFKMDDNKKETVLPQHKSFEEKEKGEGDVLESEMKTPTVNTKLTKQTSSLEKIINRFKKVRASVFPMDVVGETKNTVFPLDEPKDCAPISEEKGSVSSFNVDVTPANRILLPDLLSPSVQFKEISPVGIEHTKCSDFFDLDIDEENLEGPRRPRESLGTALGVDHTFLDQFDLID